MMRFRRVLLPGVIFLFYACSYQFQGNKNPLQQAGIEKVYISSFKNNTYRPGIEQLFSTAMIREFQKYRNFQLVSSEKEADAILSGEITSADTGIVSQNTFDIGEKKISVGSEFNSSVSCTVKLEDKFGHVLFSQTLGSNKTFSGGLPSQVGDAGATTPLVNESEQRMAIQFLASQMMASVYQRLIDTF